MSVERTSFGSLGKALLQAAEKGDVVEVSTLLEHGVFPDAKDDESNTPLIQAATFGHVDVVQRLLKVLNFILISC